MATRMDTTRNGGTQEQKSKVLELLNGILCGGMLLKVVSRGVKMFPTNVLPH